MRVIYVAGCYLGKSDWETYCNIHDARVVAHRLWDEGWAVICPHSNTAFLGGEGERDRDNPDGEWAKFINGDLAILKRCDAIFMMSNWLSSKGAQIEHDAAVGFGLEIIYE